MTPPGDAMSVHRTAARKDTNSTAIVDALRGDAMRRPEPVLWSIAVFCFALAGMAWRLPFCALIFAAAGCWYAWQGWPR